MRSRLALLVLVAGCGSGGLETLEAPAETYTYEVPQGRWDAPIDLKILPYVVSKGRGDPFVVSSTRGLPLYLDETSTKYYETVAAWEVTDRGVEQILDGASKNEELRFDYISYAIPKLITREPDGSLRVKMDWRQENGLRVYFLVYRAGGNPRRPSGQFFALTH